MDNAVNIIEKTMEEVMHDSMIPYSEFVIMDRALPRVEDGLKPVQRRILFDMFELGLLPDRPYKKCARVVGDCLGKYHPHGDSSVYQALVRMAQSFNMGSPLVDGQGNFGDIDGNGAAAMRYTECRLAPLALELLRDMGGPNDDVVKWNCNFDDTLKEPDILPGRFPNLLVNGASGIAVGLATNIPTHNLTECIDGAIAFIDRPHIHLGEMMKIIKGPDFPTGGYIISEELTKAYETGKGKIVLRAKLHLEADGDKKLIVIDELPYQVNKSALLENILKAREDKKGALMSISDITDESDRSGMRAVIKLKKDGSVKEVLQQLFKSTQLETSFNINMVAIADGKPQTMSLLGIIEYYVNYQREFIVRRSRKELNDAKCREHILEGLVIAVNNIDEVIAIIKKSRNTSEARDNLRARFSLSVIQADAILDIRLARLTRLEISKLELELNEVRERIKRLSAILASKRLQMEVVKAELTEIKKAYKTPRRSIIIDGIKDYKIEDISAPKAAEDAVLVYTAAGNIKKVPIKNYNMANRDFTDNTTLNEICIAIRCCEGAERVLMFTNLGNCYKADTADLPEAKWREKGKPLSEVIENAPANEKILYIIPLTEKVPKGNVLFYTKDGMVKKSAWEDYFSVRSSSFAAVKLKDGDEVIGIEDEKPGCSLIFVSKNGMCLNAEMSDIPNQGRVSGGVKGIQLSDGDSCVFAKQAGDGGEVVIVTDKAYSKRVLVVQLDIMSRYRKGVKITDLNSKSGNQVVFAGYVTEPYKIVLKVDDDFLSAFSTEDLSIENRTHQGRPLVKGKTNIKEVYIYKTDCKKG